MSSSEIKTEKYKDYSDSLLGMWIDNIITDGEYSKIMLKLNSNYGGPMTTNGINAVDDKHVEQELVKAIQMMEKRNR